MTDEQRVRLTALNQQISAIDQEIAHLFQERMALTSQSELAGQVSENAMNYDADLAYKGIIVDGQVAEILANKQTLPKEARVACQGIEGAFSHQAATQLFQLPHVSYYQQFDDVFQAVASGEADYGVLPIENSTAGSVVPVYDLMSKYQFYIVKTTRVSVKHHLLAAKGASLPMIQKIYSHSQALSQCKTFFAKHKQITAHAYSNTALAAQYVAQQGDKTIAAIASRQCAQMYNLDVLQEDIQDIGHNTTRFICISKAAGYCAEADKISLCLTLPHKPGALYHLLNKFAINQLNLTKLESRPWPERLFEFMFYVDIEGKLMDPKVQLLFNDLNHQLGYFRILGHYGE